MRDIVNNTEVARKLISFLQRSYNDPECKDTFIMILTALSYIFIIFLIFFFFYPENSNKSLKKNL